MSRTKRPQIDLFQRFADHATTALGDAAGGDAALEPTIRFTHTEAQWLP